MEKKNNPTFKIVKIISSYQIVINAGSNDFIKSGDIFDIYSPGQPVYDPDTKEFLGTLDIIKAKVEVIHVFPRMCVCENVKTSLTNLDFAFSTRMTLDVNPIEISGGYDSDDKTIRIGDFARVNR